MIINPFISFNGQIIIIWQINNKIIGEISIPDIEGTTLLIVFRKICVICLKNSIKLLTGLIHDKIASPMLRTLICEYLFQRILILI